MTEPTGYAPHEGRLSAPRSLRLAPLWLAAALVTLAAAPGVGCRERPALPATTTSDRIVSLAPNVTELLFALGAGPRVVGATRYCDYPPEARAIPRIGGFVDPSFEAVVGRRPDLVVGIDDPGIRTFHQRLRAAGIAVLALEMQSLDQIRAATRTLGARIGRGEAATALVTALDTRIGAVTRAIEGAPRPRVLAVYGRRPLVVAGAGSFPDALIARAGGANVAAGSAIPWPTWSMEEVLRAAPEVILDCTMGSEAEATTWEDWAAVPAVRDGRVVRFGDESLLRPGPRIADGLEALARALHPGLHLGAPP